MMTLSNSLRISCTSLALVAASSAMADGPGFDDVALGTTYYCTDSDTSTGVSYAFSDFEMYPGTFSNNGHAVIVNGLNACGSDQELNLSNIYVTYDFAGSSGSVADPSILIGWLGGAVNLSINGDRRWAPNPGAFPASIGGCSVSITSLGAGCGRVDISGTVNTLSFGGQEFWLDAEHGSSTDTECDWGYEDLDTAFTLTPSSTFTTDGLYSKVRPFTLYDGSLYWGGSLNVSHTNQACNTGQELEVRNVTLSHNIIASGAAYENVEWAFGYYGGTVNFEINGDFRNETSIADLDGQTVGSCLVTIVSVTPDCGWIQMDGIVETISIGGQELFVDCLKGDEVETTIPGDIDGDGDVDVDDLMALIAAYGSSCSGCPEDIDGDGDVDVDDLMILLGNYGS